MKEAIDELAPEYGCDLLDPSRIYLRTDEDTAVLYHPDSMWAYGRKHLDLTIWEIETDPSCKTVAGDIALAAECGSSKVEIYPYKGSVRHAPVLRIRKPVRFRDLNDRRRCFMEIDPDNYEALPRPTYLSFMLVLSDVDSYRYYKRYLSVLAKKKRPWPFDYATALYCTSASVPNVRRSLSNSRETQEWDSA